MIIIGGFSDSDVSAQECPPTETEVADTIRIAIVVDHSSAPSEFQINEAITGIENVLNSVKSTDSTEVIVTKLKNHHLDSNSISLYQPAFKLDDGEGVKDCECNDWLKICIPKDEYKRLKHDHGMKININVKAFQENILFNADSLLRLDPEDDSPILREIRSLDHNVCNEKCDQLWIISDMLENSLQFNFYESVPNFQNAESKIKRHFGFPQNIGSTIVFNINRCHGDGGGIQESDNFEPFWNDYFTRVTGRKPSWEYLPTGGDCPEQDDS